MFLSWSCNFAFKLQYSGSLFYICVYFDRKTLILKHISDDCIRHAIFSHFKKYWLIAHIYQPLCHPWNIFEASAACEMQAGISKPIYVTAEFNLGTSCFLIKQCSCQVFCWEVQYCLLFSCNFISIWIKKYTQVNITRKFIAG